VEVLKSEKLDLVDFLFLSGQKERLAQACRVQLLWKGRARASVDRERVAASAGKGKGVMGFISGRRPFMSFIRLETAAPTPDGLNFYERAVYSGAGDDWFPEHEQALIAAYNRQGLMKENSVGYRGEELRRMYQEGVDLLMSALKRVSSEERASMLNDFAAWYFAFFALPLPVLEPKALKAFRARRNAEHLQSIISDPGIVARLKDAALYAIAAAEAVAG
jgi:hypothetical protein